ncbi:hypothetical protein HLH26_07155 [Gluconacetobacter sp. 1b LMG 1731]|uniref:Transposase n=1 Tax=Gluconacetobacter dulcium TaxID=2729096 RepID=A0A7W4NS66_9PROT|nr:hypothetical protein [Gluconacetobacter dulcium]MBB2164321.1 hypothetical protein [Gluconacetobacter dulcium]MBB2193609.1 hypothetical protein [Gluconacetobacter dulcium]
MRAFLARLIQPSREARRLRQENGQLGRELANLRLELVLVRRRMTLMEQPRDACGRFQAKTGAETDMVRAR